MLPAFLTGSYKRYKEDTNVFTTWLSKAAIACGWNARDLQEANSAKSQSQSDAPSKEVRLKGRARKLAKEAGESSKKTANQTLPAKNYRVTGKIILQQAEIVAKSKNPLIPLPANVLRVLERAINARRRCSAWFRKTGVDNHYSDAGHLYFIDVLEKALGILKPNEHGVDNSAQSASQLTIQPSEQKGKSKPSTFDLINSFEMLKVEYFTEGIDLDSADVDVSAKAPTGRPPAPEIYELEDDSDGDLAFDVFCFFEDLHHIQAFLADTWEKYGDGELDLVTAAMTTNAALDLVRRAEEEIIALDPENFTKKNAYRAITSVIFYADSLATNEDHKARLESSDSLKVTEFDEAVYLSTYRTLSKFAQIFSFHIEMDYPVMAVPARFSYISRPELLDLPAVKKWEAEDQLLAQFVMDIHLNDILKNSMSDMISQSDGARAPPMEDELSNAITMLIKEQEVSVWVVFAARVFLDMQDILGSRTKRAHKELRRAGKAADMVFDWKDDGEGIEPGSSGERWLSKDTKLLMGLHEMTKMWIGEDLIAGLKERLVENLEDPAMRGLEDLDPETREHVLAHLRAKGHDTTPPTAEHEANA